MAILIGSILMLLVTALPPTIALADSVASEDSLRRSSDDVMGTLVAGQFGAACAQILTGNFVYDEHQKLSSRYRTQQYYNWACRSDFNSVQEMKQSSVSLGIPVEGLPVPLRLDAVFDSADFKQSLSEWCSTAWEQLADQATYEEFSRVVNQGMVSAYKTCIDAEKQTLLQKYGAFAYVTPQDDYLREFIVSLELRPPVPGQKLVIQSIEGSDFTCTKGNVPFKTPFEVKGAFTLALTCTKLVDDSRVITFNTTPAGQSPPVKMPGLSEGKILEMEQRLTGIAQATIATRNETRRKSEVQSGAVTPGDRENAISITFPHAFTSKPIVRVSIHGINGDQAPPKSFNIVLRVPEADITTSGFRVELSQSGGGATILGITWIAHNP